MKYRAVTISGKICSGKSTIFESLVKKLGWPSYSASQFFRKWSEEHHFPIFEAEARPASLTKEIDQGMKDKLQEGNLILEGWLAGYMAQGIPRVLKVLLVCQDEERISRFSQRENVTLTTARREVEKREAALLGKWLNVYGREDFFEAKFYDLVIDTTYLEQEAVVGKILEKLKD